MGRSVEEHARAVAAAIANTAARRASDPAEIRAVTDVFHGRLAEPATAAHDVPGFDNSQMDGFAVVASDLAESGLTPVTLVTMAHVVAGGDAPPAVGPGSVAPIMTGAPIPAGADAVVAVERTRPGDFGPVEGGAAITFDSPVTEGTFIRRRGADIETGAVLLPAGAPLHPAAVSALVAAGVETVAVRPALRLAVIGTGTEVTRGLVPNSNSAALVAHARELGLTPQAHTVEDDPAEFAALLARVAPTVDLIVTTGGVSAGTREVVRQVLEPTVGAWFDHVDVQPGGPQGLAEFHDGDRVVPVVCLPGNPVSVLVSFELFLRGPLSEQAGRISARAEGHAPLAEALQSPAGRRQVRRGRFGDDGTVHLEGGPGSHLVASYARADLLVFVPEDVTALAAGDTVQWWRIA